MNYITKLCEGKTKGKPCIRTIKIRKGEIELCWEHKDIINTYFKEKTKRPPKIFTVEVIKKEERLKELSKDEENVHTPEVNDILQKSIENIKAWAENYEIKTEESLYDTIQTFLLSNDGRSWRGNDTVNGALMHLRECYQFDDPMEILGVTYPQLSSWVWARIIKTTDENKKQFLLQRFFEEIFEGTKLCLNGNMARLMNVFACIDDEINPQDGSNYYTPEILQQSIYNLIYTPNIELDELVHKIRSVLFEAKVPVDLWGDWIDAAIDEKLNSI
jgi:hypothetical protein